MRPIDADVLFEISSKERDEIIRRLRSKNDDAGLAIINLVYKTIHQYIADSPTIDAEPVKHGHWIRVRWIETPSQPDEGYWIVRCSACSIPDFVNSRFCPHCGAKMDEEAGDGV